ncbi:hypothetical protein MJO29_000775 [Puccinia striiformis f. sp. tritici]|uniref:hypothetical protein n=1 Tax=Puccinia striiformis f. sp. tritici TaxID=168172 RepID=UPI00200763A7|nr:hypothetical protein Pst134EA_000788 [Puccinia striiformis f. sp. tritici]KAH9473708.1 hypothetical protein Pst134EA_000788 [Puccinia striiformis f. sp. tritici]KAI7967498.1 hypothetical protein MJO29_000775 [Puccinia striiformis f. sp. tritici]KAI9603663.1 hypothetical protein KEM48_000424 [Puccinia striiformis f. sp. tritici PST-130]
MVASSSNKISHPMFVSGPFEVMAALEPVLTQGSAYGQFRNQSTISYFNDSGDKALVEVIVSGYGSAATALTPEAVHYLSGRFIARLDIPREEDPYVFYDQELTLNVGTFANIPSGIANKVGVKGLGIVVERTLLDAPSAANSLQQDLHVMIRHTDYDNLRKDKAVFEVMYIVPGNRLQHKTHGLYQVGREVHLTGYIRGFNALRKCWEVQVLSLSVPSGNQSSVSPTKVSRIATKRNVKIQRVGSMMSSAAAAPVASTSRLPPIVTPSAIASEDRPSFQCSSASNIQYPEEGEVTETGNGDAENEEPFENMYGKKRTGAEMVAESRKRSKGK